MSEVRLIDANALKEVIKANHYLLSAKNNSTDYGMFTTGIMQAIDNAPTVKFSLLPADETKEEAYKRGYEKGKIKGILKANTRSQGDLADEVWKLYEKHQSHLATYVLEFGYELKDLLSKYQKGGAE